MDKMKQWIALSVVAAVAILAGGWFLVVSPKRADAAALRDEAATQEHANQALNIELTRLKAQAKGLPAQQARLAAVAAKIPSNSAMVPLVLALNKAASDVGVELVSIAPGVATPVGAAPAAPQKAGTATTVVSADLMQVPVALN